MKHSSSPFSFPDFLVLQLIPLQFYTPTTPILTPTHDSVFSFNVTSIEKLPHPSTPSFPKIWLDSSGTLYHYSPSQHLPQHQINLCNYLFKVCLLHWAESSMKARTSLSYSLGPNGLNSVPIAEQD